MFIILNSIKFRILIVRYQTYNLLHKYSFHGIISNINRSGSIRASNNSWIISKFCDILQIDASTSQCHVGVILGNLVQYLHMCSWVNDQLCFLCTNGMLPLSFDIKCIVIKLDYKYYRKWNKLIGRWVLLSLENNSLFKITEKWYSTSLQMIMVT